METSRLILRKYKKEDFNDFYEYISNAQVVRFEPYQPMSAEEAQKHLSDRILSDEFIAVELKESGKMIGNVYLGRGDFQDLELGFVFNDKYGKKGYATEACVKLIEEAFSGGIHRIHADCDPENQDSWKLLERLGFHREAHLKENVYFWKDSENNPIWKDTFIYSLLRTPKNN